MTPTPVDRDGELQRIADAETFQSYFSDHATDERHPQPGVDATHSHFGQYLDTHPTQES